MKKAILLLMMVGTVTGNDDVEALQKKCAKLEARMHEANAKMIEVSRHALPNSRELNAAQNEALTSQRAYREHCETVAAQKKLNPPTPPDSKGGQPGEAKPEKKLPNAPRNLRFRP